MPSSWLDLLGAGLTGGGTVKVLELAWSEIKTRRADRRSARDVIERHLDPVLKAADELVGKLLALAKSDFVGLADADGDDHSTVDGAMPLASSVYLFAQFWSHLQILRAEALYTNLRAVEEGLWLQGFMDTLESSRIRLVERARQRGIGEAIIAADRQRPITFYEFLERFGDREGRLREWLAPVTVHLSKSNHTSHRQTVLVYGAVVHALIDSLDPDHVITGDRPGWPNKLTRRSRHDLRFRVFNEYLPFVENPNKYTQTGT